MQKDFHILYSTVHQYDKLQDKEYYVVQYSDMSRGDYVIKVLEDRDKALKVAEEECQALKREYEVKDDDYYEALEYSEF